MNRDKLTELFGATILENYGAHKAKKKVEEKAKEKAKENFHHAGTRSFEHWADLPFLQKRSIVGPCRSRYVHANATSSSAESACMGLSISWT